jgi:hypothetical protein
MGGMQSGEWCAYMYVFPNSVLHGDLGVIWVCNVGANGCMCFVLGENEVFRIMLNIQRVCVVSIGGPLLSCSLVLSEKK